MSPTTMNSHLAFLLCRHRQTVLFILLFTDDIPAKELVFQRK